MKTQSSNTYANLIRRSVRLEGLTSIMFDRYAGDNDTKLLWHQKIYQIPESDTLCLPVINIVSFYSAHNTNSAPKRLRDSRKYKALANACLSFVQIESKGDHPDYIPLLKDDKEIKTGTFDAEYDSKSGIFLHRSVARLEKGIPNPKERPVLPLPWALEFNLTIFPNQELKEQDLKNLFEEGGIAIGLGTFRGVYGKFRVARWE